MRNCAMRLPVRNGSLTDLLRLAAIVMSLFGCLSAGAGEMARLRPVTSVWTVSAGVERMTDTYLSPLANQGIALELSYSRCQVLRCCPDRWTLGLEFSAHAGLLSELPTRSTALDVLDCDLRASAAVWRRWSLAADKFTVGVGPSLDLTAGVGYAQSNFNNPASARATVAAGVSGLGVMHTHIKRLPVDIGCRATLPLLGASFAPGYTESYYEIYLGNRSGLVHAVWPGSWRGLDASVWADFRFGNTGLRVSYRFDGTTRRFNNLTLNRAVHLFGIGVVTDILSVSPRTAGLDAAQIIRAY